MMALAILRPESLGTARYGTYWEATDHHHDDQVVQQTCDSVGTGKHDSIAMTNERVDLKDRFVVVDRMLLPPV
ncbi:hypothetical protein CGZ80_03315 [Rhodopirellula sp. MGV]|nr:hypothetical protein CGZ80_03315 [Rhodopirellula sp. MGV]PNY38596.1 hypothetical protein C2E31_01370 [Rhodopirellula baltica]